MIVIIRDGQTLMNNKMNISSQEGYNDGNLTCLYEKLFVHLTIVQK